MVTQALQSAEILAKTKQILNGLEIPFCLFLGTSLGAYRDGTFCPGDEDDMDLAIDIKYYDRLDEIIEAFKGFEYLHNFLNDDGIAPEVSFRWWWKGCYSKIDLFFISEQNEKKCWRFYLNDDPKDYITKYFDKKHWESWDKVTFFGEEYNIPGHIEEYLTSNYGDWKTPIHRKDWDWKTDNKCQESRS